MTCKAPVVDARFDRQQYSLTAGDTLATVKLIVSNRTAHPIYLQTVAGLADVLILVRVDQRGNVAFDSKGQERWSLWPYWKSMPAMGTARIDPGSDLASSYRLPRGDFRVGLGFGDSPNKLTEHHILLRRFSVR